jgi:hypothetical protein
VQEPYYAEELAEILYIKPHTINANKESDLTLGTSAPHPKYRRVVSPRSGGVKIGKIEAYCVSRDRSTVPGQGPQKAMFSIKTNENRPSGTFARGAAGIGCGRQR